MKKFTLVVCCLFLLMSLTSCTNENVTTEAKEEATKKEVKVESDDNKDDIAKDNVEASGENSGLEAAEQDAAKNTPEISDYVINDDGTITITGTKSTLNDIDKQDLRMYAEFLRDYVAHIEPLMEQAVVCLEYADKGKAIAVSDKYNSLVKIPEPKGDNGNVKQLYKLITRSQVNLNDAFACLKLYAKSNVSSSANSYANNTMRSLKATNANFKNINEIFEYLKTQ